MLYNYTNWGHVASVFRNAKHVNRFVKVIMELLRTRKCILSGLDVTGLPEDGADSVTSITPRIKPNFEATRPTNTNTVLSNLKTELTELEALFDTAIKPIT